MILDSNHLFRGGGERNKTVGWEERTQCENDGMETGTMNPCIGMLRTHGVLCSHFRLGEF